MLSAVLDTNVIISGTISSKGAPSELLTAWRERWWTLIISPMILAEVDRVLRLPRIIRAYALSHQDIAEVIRLLESRAVVVPGRLQISPSARDPEDDHVLACALEGHADYVVTGDQDLLILERYQDIPIATPASFAAIIEATR